MGMKRQFQAECDCCHRLDTEKGPWASDIRDRLRRLGWTVGNELYCPVCNETDKNYDAFDNGEDDLEARIESIRKRIALKMLEKTLSEVMDR